MSLQLITTHCNMLERTCISSWMFDEKRQNQRVFVDNSDKDKLTEQWTFLHLYPGSLKLEWIGHEFQRRPNWMGMNGLLEDYGQVCCCISPPISLRLPSPCFPLLPSLHCTALHLNLVLNTKYIWPRCVPSRAVEPDFKKYNKKSDAQGACRRLYPTFKCCCWCFRWIGLALVVILRCVWPLWDFSFRSYEHFKIIICLRTIIVTLSRPFWLSIQDISINEVLFLPKVW